MKNWIDINELPEGNTLEEKILNWLKQTSAATQHAYEEEVIDKGKCEIDFHLNPNDEFLGEDAIKDISVLLNQKSECSKECKCCSGDEGDTSEYDFQNDCYMWTLQLKAFILDTMIDPKKRNSQAFLDFLDELNKISVSL